jgi:DNA-binding HxlR family transcriptional regulator
MHKEFKGVFVVERERLIVLSHHRWSVPVLAELERSSGCKFVTLVRRLGVSRDSLRHTLEALIENGWVLRNPGYGHPLRPEYVLTPQGAELAPACRRLLRVLRRLGVEETGLRKWTLPVILSLGRGPGRFSDLLGLLPGVTSRALAIALKALQAERLVERRVVEDYPPTTRYRLTRRGRRVLGPLENLPIPGTRTA